MGEKVYGLRFKTINVRNNYEFIKELAPSISATEEQVYEMLKPEEVELKVFILEMFETLFKKYNI